MFIYQEHSSDDILAYNSSKGKFDRKAKGANGTFLGVSGGILGYYVPGDGGGGGGETSIPTITQYWQLYIDTTDANKVKATNGVTTYTHATNATSVLQDVFTNTSSSIPLFIEVGPGDFRLETKANNAVFWRSNFAIVGRGSGLTNFIITNAGLGGFEFRGSGTGSQNNLTANCTKGSATCAVTTATGFAANDYILLRSTADALPSTSDKGEINRIVSISGTTVTLEKWSRDDYNTADTANIKKINFLQNLHFAGFTVKAESGYLLANADTFFRVDFTDNCQMRDVKIQNAIGDFHKALVLFSVINSRFENLEFEKEPIEGAVTTSGPYAISVRSACENLTFDKPIAKGGWRHVFTTTGTSETDRQGVPRNILIKDGNSDTTGEASWDTHAEGYYIVFDGCRTGSARPPSGEDSDAFNLRSKDSVIRNATISNCCGVGIGLDGNAAGCRLENIFIRNVHQKTSNSSGMGINIGDGLDDLMIDGFDIEGCDRSGINIEGGGGTGNIMILNGKIRNTGRITTAASGIDGTDVSDVKISNLRINTGNASKAIESAGTSDRWDVIAVDASGSATSTFTGSDNKIDTPSCRGL